MPKKLDPADCPFIDHSASEFNRGQHGAHKGDYDEDSLDGFIVHEPKPKPRKRLSGKQTRAKERKKRSKKKLKKRTTQSDSEDEFVVPDKKKRMTDLVAIANEEGQPEWGDRSLGQALAIKRHELDINKGRKPARPPPLMTANIEKAYVQQTIHNYHGPVIQQPASLAMAMPLGAGAMPQLRAPPLLAPPLPPRPTHTLQPIDERLILALRSEKGDGSRINGWLASYREVHEIIAAGGELRGGYLSDNEALARWLQNQQRRETELHAIQQQLLRLLRRRPLP